MPPSAEVASALAGCGTATIVGDSDGVCVVPQASLDRLPEAAAARETKENGIREENSLVDARWSTCSASAI